MASIYIFIFIPSDTGQQSGSLQSCDLLHVPDLMSLALTWHDSLFDPQMTKGIRKEYAFGLKEIKTSGSQ